MDGVHLPDSALMTDRVGRGDDSTLSPERDDRRWVPWLHERPLRDARRGLEAIEPTRERTRQPQPCGSPGQSRLMGCHLGWASRPSTYRGLSESNSATRNRQKVSVELFLVKSQEALRASRSGPRTPPEPRRTPSGGPPAGPWRRAFGPYVGSGESPLIACLGDPSAGHKAAGWRGVRVREAAFCSASRRAPTNR